MPEGLTQFREASGRGTLLTCWNSPRPSNAPDQARVDGVWPYLQSVANLPEQQARVLQQRWSGNRAATRYNPIDAGGLIRQTCFARDAGPRAASLAGLAAETVGRMATSTPARWAACPACRRPLRPGASSSSRVRVRAARGRCAVPADRGAKPCPDYGASRGIELADEPQRPAPAAAPEAQGRRAPSRLPPRRPPGGGGGDDRHPHRRQAGRLLRDPGHRTCGGSPR